jgi:hypothetical protein
MRRISDEDGRSAGLRNFGRLALSWIPFALGLGASVWLGVWIQAHYFLIDRAQEQRRGSYVRSPDPQRAAYIVTTANGMKTSVDKVDIENGQMTVRFHNFTNSEAMGLQLGWQWIAPDGTRLSDHYDWLRHLDGPSSLNSGLTGIVTEKDLHADPRASGIEVWVTGDK